MPFIVVDIDGTILRNEARKQACLREASGKRFPKRMLSNPIGRGVIREQLTRPQWGKFYDCFFSGKRIHLDRPVPFAAAVLRRLHRSGIGIVYLTGRHHMPEDSMKAKTLLFLRQRRFPFPDGRTVLLDMSARKFPAMAKEARMLKLLKKEEIIAGIGDEPVDAAAARAAGVPALILDRGVFAPEEFPAGTVLAKSWKEIEQRLQRLLSRLLL